jgi:hypothetical protein
VPEIHWCHTLVMPTDIYFAGQDVRVQVYEDPSQVAEAFASARGLPFRLTGHDGQSAMYINPLTVAFWSAGRAGPAPERPHESTEPRTKRQTVTDVWGRPLSGKTIP